MDMEKRYKCRKCGQTRDRMMNTTCEYDGGSHDWGDRDEVNAELAYEAEEQARREAEEAKLRRLKAKKRRQEAELDYETFLNSAEGQAELVKIANGHLARQRRASLGIVISGVVTLIVALIFCIVFYKYVETLLVGGSFLESFKEFFEFFFKSLLLAVIPGSISITLFQKFWKTRSKLRSELRSVHNTKTGRTVPVMEAARFFASRDISRRFAYKDEYGDPCVPDTLTPAPNDTTADWEQKIKHARLLYNRKNYADAAREFIKIGKECGVLTFSATAWFCAALCYETLGDERTAACYRNAVRGYKKLVSQGHEGAQTDLADAERKLAEFLSRNA